MSSIDRSQLPFILITIPIGVKAAPQKGKQWKLTNVCRIDHETGTDSILFYKSIPMIYIGEAIPSGSYQNLSHLTANVQAPTNMKEITVSYPNYLALGGGPNAKAYVCALEQDEIEIAEPKTEQPSIVQKLLGGWKW